MSKLIVSPHGILLQKYKRARKKKGDARNSGTASQGYGMARKKYGILAKRHGIMPKKTGQALRECEKRTQFKLNKACVWLASWILINVGQPSDFLWAINAINHCVRPKTVLPIGIQYAQENLQWERNSKWIMCLAGQLNCSEKSRSAVWFSLSNFNFVRCTTT